MTSYTPAQRAAINADDTVVQIIACAGSGKTQVIAQRIARILARSDVAPRNIVAFTFTEKAAAELKDRVLTLVEQDGPVTGLAEMYIGTMHGYTLDLLQRLVPETFKYQVLTDITARLLIDRNSRKSGLTECPTSSPNTAHLRRYVHSKLYLQVAGVLREDDTDVEQVPRAVLESFYKYLKLLTEHAFFDYTQMINLAVGFLESDPDDGPAEKMVLDHVRDDLRYLVVDEYQDVNPLQERLIRGLTRFGAELCVVGDDDQTIYQWRGSEVTNIVTFDQRYEGVRSVELADNFRSSRGVVELGRSVAELIPFTERLPKAMTAAGHQQWARGDLLALGFDQPADEARWICDRIEAMRGLAFTDAPSAGERGLSWSDFAVLYRTVKDADPLVDELRRRNIPYVVKGLNRLFDSPEITAVVGIFRYIVAEVDAAGLHDLWSYARLLPEGSSWAAAMAVLDEGRDFDKGARWGVYNIQRLYLDFLEKLSIRENTLPGDASRQELVFYQLGKFSQAISDFEQIYFSTAPFDKYTAFAKWLEHQAPDYYAESDADVGYAAPDAVVLSTVHQAKGMQWPAVFVPCLRRNRFPSRRSGGLNLFHVVPAAAVHDPDRYRGTVQDETRLFYVAVTRAQKYLFVSHSPGSSSQYSRRSEFFDHCTRSTWMSTRDKGVRSDAARTTPAPRKETPQVNLSFSELKYFFECPYEFKLRFLYGFNPPLHEALGFGKGLHDALAEVHKRSILGDIPDVSAADELVTRHLHTPYAYPELRGTLRKAAVESVVRYLRQHEHDLARTEHSEEPVQVHVGSGITVDGRIDLVRRLDTDELSIVDFKSSERSQAEEVTRDQLHVYALGYRELTGIRADLIEVLNLDQNGQDRREDVEEPLLDGVRARVRQAGESLRDNDLPKHESWCKACDRCDLAGLCRDRPD